MKDTYKSIDELTPDQYDELRQRAELDLMDMETPDDWWNEDGSLKDNIVKKCYGDTVFTDDDFICTATEVA